MRGLMLGGALAVLIAAPVGAQAAGIATVSGNAFNHDGVWDYDSVAVQATGTQDDDITFTDAADGLTVRDPGVAIAGATDGRWTTFLPPSGLCAGPTGDGTSVCTDVPLVCSSGIGSATCLYATPNLGSQTELGAISADGGPGNDRIVIPNVRSTIGNEAFGGPGDDDLTATYVTGGAGADILRGSVFYDDKSEGISASDDGVADDGTPGEHDNIAAGHSVEGTPFADVIRLGGDSWADGGAGDDVVTTVDGQAQGGGGADTVTVTGTGFAMGDGYYEDPRGDDTIDVRNGVANTVMCGPGDDTVLADALDSAPYRDCEHVMVG